MPRGSVPSKDFVHNEETHQDVTSVTSSVELTDAIIDETWFRVGETHSKKPTGERRVNKDVRIEMVNLGGQDVANPSLISRWIQSWQDRMLLKRLDRFDLDEVKTFVAQKLFKVDGIICDEQTKLTLVEKMVVLPSAKDFDTEKAELKRKYGTRLVAWLKDRLLPSVNESQRVLDRALRDFNHLKQVDPLANWYKQSSESCARMLDRIHSFAAAMTNMVKYSLIIEPGTITPHLSEYIAEFRQLESFFERNEMSPAEAVQSAFSKNFLTKSRNKLLECADCTRVVLRPLNPSQLYDDEFSFNGSIPHRAPSPLFQDEDVPSPTKLPTSYGTSDFIHASYVRGGPLLNTFICTQAPMPSTLSDFWRMVWQERSQYIFMLCGAVDVNALGLLDSAIPNFCPYYWPRAEGEEMCCGNLLIRNERIDGTLDPLFNVTYLSLRRTDGPLKNEVRLVEHWQYDWKEFSDCHWPLRVLRRARLSPTPTIVQCLDGCGRSGTLVTIEALLMHMLRGSAHYEKLVLTSAIFVRLQRRHAITSPIQYLYIYRTLLHWMQPYITPIYQRFVLGLIFPNWGFVGKYNKILASHAKIAVI